MNSASAWLVVPFLVGTRSPRRRPAAALGLITCLAQLAGDTLTSELRGDPVSTGLLLFWSACGLLGGPIFGLGGLFLAHDHGRLRALGTVLLPSAFLVEGLWVDGARLGYWSSAVFWTAIAVAPALCLARDLRTARWFALTLSVGHIGELVLNSVDSQAF